MDNSYPVDKPVIPMSSHGKRRLPLRTDDGEEAIAALASETARDIYSSLLMESNPPVTIADHLELSVQSVHYHLRNLEEAGLVRDAGVEYSEKGVEMTVYEAIPIEIVVTTNRPDEASTRST